MIWQDYINFYTLVYASCGYLIGSLLNLIVINLPKKLDDEYKNFCYAFLELPPVESKQLSINSSVVLRPNCISCNHKLSLLHVFHLTKILFFFNKCSNCNAQNTYAFPNIEIITMLAFYSCVLVYGWNVTMLAGSLFICLLIVGAYIDYQHMILPDEITIWGVWLGLILSLFGMFTSPVNAIIGAVIGYLSLWCIFWLFYILTGKEGLGGGDFKFLAMCGAWFGCYSLPIILGLAALIGCIVSFALILLRKIELNKPIPFGPFLSFSAYVYLITNTKIKYLLNGFYDFGIV